MADMNGHAMTKNSEVDSPVWIGVSLALLVVIVALVFSFTTASEQQAAQSLVPRILGVVATLAIFSILYKENPLFRFVEHIFIGLAVGYGTILAWMRIVKPLWYEQYMPNSVAGGTEGGQWWLLIPFLFGLLFFTVYFPRISWMNRFIMSVLMGFAAGFAFKGFVNLLGPQLVAAFRPPLTVYQPTGVEAGINNIPVFGVWLHPFALIAFIVMSCTLAYFFFSIEHKSAWIRKPANAGRVFIMITLGAIFGTTVMGRFSLVIERFSYLLESVREFAMRLLT